MVQPWERDTGLASTCLRGRSAGGTAYRFIEMQVVGFRGWGNTCGPQKHAHACVWKVGTQRFERVLGQLSAVCLQIQMGNKMSEMKDQQEDHGIGVPKA